MKPLRTLAFATNGLVPRQHDPIRQIDGGHARSMESVRELEPDDVTIDLARDVSLLLVDPDCDAHVERMARGAREPHLDCTAGSLSAVDNVLFSPRTWPRRAAAALR